MTLKPDDTIIYHHRACGWCDEPRPIGFAMVNECPCCRKRNVLSFVTYRSWREFEVKAAQRLIEEGR